MDDENTNKVNTDDQEDDTLAGAVDEENDAESDSGTASGTQLEDGVPDGNLRGSGSDSNIPTPDNM